MLSIIIVNWNAKKYLSDCLRSLSSSRKTIDLEIIVVDNASDDGSQGMIRKEFPFVKLICNQENLGFAKANNIGIANCSGKYIAFVNSDVEVLDACLDRLISFMDQNPEIGLLGPQIVGADGNIQRSCMGFPTVWNTFCRTFSLDILFPRTKLFGGFLMTYWAHDTLREVDVINGCFWLVRRTALDQVGVLDDLFFIYAEDKDWCKRFWEMRWKVVFYPEARAVHYGGGSSSNAPLRFYLELQRANYQYWQKHHNPFSQAVFLFLTGVHHTIRLLGYIALYTVKKTSRASILYKINRSTTSIRWLLSVPFRNNSVKSSS